MGIEELIKFAGDTSAPVLLSILIIYWYRMDTKAQIEAAQEWRELQREEKMVMAKVVERNTETMATIMSTITEQRAESKEMIDEYRTEARQLRQVIESLRDGFRNKGGAD